MSKTVEKALLSQNWAHKMFYVMLHDHFKELQKYRNLQFLVKISPKITFYIVREYYIITIYIFTKEIYHNMQYEINGWLMHRFVNTPLAMGNTNGISKSEFVFGFWHNFVDYLCTILQNKGYVDIWQSPLQWPNGLWMTP